MKDKTSFMGQLITSFAVSKGDMIVQEEYIDSVSGFREQINRIKKAGGWSGLSPEEKQQFEDAYRRVKSMHTGIEFLDTGKITIEDLFNGQINSLK